jgi:hypothetical protein
MRNRSSITVAAATASLLLVGGIAYAAVQSVDTNPKPQVVIPSSASHHQSAGHATDDPATHDVNDDNGGATSGHGTDDPTTHDVNDDNGGSGSSGRGGSDDSGSGHGGHGSDD